MRNPLCIKHIIHTTIGLILIASCTKNEISDDKHNDMPMRFRVSTAASKAIVSNDVFLQPGTTFKVWGNYHTSNGTSYSTVFDGTQMTYNGCEWTYDDPQYWFPGCTYAFRAVYPSEVSQVSLKNDHFKIENFDATKAFDLLLAEPDAIHCGVNQTMPPVALNFRHLLSRVAFIGKSDPTLLGDGRQIVIEEAVLSGVYKTGNWSGATFDANTSDTWTPTGAPQNYTVTNITLATDGTNLFTDELFIPQDLTNAELTIKFHYNVKNGTAKTFTSTTQLSTLLPKWEAGKSYRYPFTIGSHIFFTKPTIDKWVYAPINNTNDFNIYPTN